MSHAAVEDVISTLSTGCSVTAGYLRFTVGATATNLDPPIAKPRLPTAEEQIVSKAKELARLCRLNDRFRGWDRDIDHLTSELVALAKKLPDDDA